MKYLYSFSIAFLAYTLTLNAQKEGLGSINKTDLRAYMNFFASDLLEGRETGTRGNDAAALYIKTSLMRLGLKPIPETGDFYQKIPLTSSEIKKKDTYLKVRMSTGDTVLTTDSLVYLSPPSITTDLSGKVVFVGFGYEDRNSGYDDLKDVDLKDKVVLIMTGNPQSAAQDEKNLIFDTSLEEPKLMSVLSKEPKAILYVYNPTNKFHDPFASGLSDMGLATVGNKIISLKNKEIPSIPFQIVFITQYAADILLKSTGYNLKQMQEKIIASGKPVSVELPDIIVSLNTFIESNDFYSPNVIGIVEGSDPMLKNECVIYSAHFDHEGVDDKGEVFNGADDNASGSMALLGIAQAFMSLKKKPSRTILFLWANGEEKGLLGSVFYTDNPVIPMENTLLDINLDMVGRSKMPSDTGKFMGFDLTITRKGEILLYTDQVNPELNNILSSSSKEAGIRIINMGKDPQIGSSDYASFMAKGVPALFFNSGIYPDLHTIRDDFENIDFDKMEKVSKMVFLIGYNFANQKERIKSTDPK
jgi:hypothetical protein